ncbi:hypothetical protein [Hymenobacter jejuensis]|uniref:Uncharacterized protein n=1 Tax=Hymenobacter jejuensis TaxID=2502781 RepID=A0A5B8A618_9BACT|nr:hypothetical protein [Hymenobacter jejuensis]QDA62163.1 hypothetical protein FHG12_19580 [Hymenobacter jejuensis]
MSERYIFHVPKVYATIISKAIVLVNTKDGLQSIENEQVMSDLRKLYDTLQRQESISLSKAELLSLIDILQPTLSPELTFEQIGIARLFLQDVMVEQMAFARL